MDMNANEPMPMDQPEMDGPDSMGPSMDDGEMPEEPAPSKNNEIDDIFSKLDTEKQAAVIKYAKSMVDGDAVSEPTNEEQVVTEIVNNILDDQEQRPEERKDMKIRNKKVTMSSPFVGNGKQSRK